MENVSSDAVKLITSESISDIDEQIVKYYLGTINEIKSKTLKNEFINILSNSKDQNIDSTSVLEKKEPLSIPQLFKSYQKEDVNNYYSLVKS